MSGGEATAVDAVGWRAVNPEMGDQVFVCPRCWPDVAAHWRARADATVRELAARAGVGALRRVRSGVRVLMTRIEDGLPEATVRRGTAPWDGDPRGDGRAAAV